jgi:hypothetical protein
MSETAENNINSKKTFSLGSFGRRFDFDDFSAARAGQNLVVQARRLRAADD